MSFLLPLGVSLLSNLLGVKGSGRKMRASRRRRVRGAGMLDFLKKGRDFAKKHQVISKLADVGASLGFKPEMMGKVSSVAKTLGYGKKRSTYRRKSRGGALRLAGGRRVYL